MYLMFNSSSMRQFYSVTNHLTGLNETCNVKVGVMTKSAGQVEL